MITSLPPILSRVQLADCWLNAEGDGTRLMFAIDWGGAPLPGEIDVDIGIGAPVRFRQIGIFKGLTYFAAMPPRQEYASVPSASVACPLLEGPLERGRRHAS
jgi:hypothetical protein